MPDPTPRRGWIRPVSDIAGSGGAVALAGMVLVIGADVALRLLGRGFAGTSELVSDWFMVAIVFLALGGLQARKMHISVDLARGTLPPRLDAALDLLAATLMLAACAGLAWYTTGQAYHATLAGERVELPDFILPVWPPRWFVPLGFVLAGGIAAAQAVTAVGTLIRGAR